jgi:hypothetical protein
MGAPFGRRVLVGVAAIPPRMKPRPIQTPPPARKHPIALLLAAARLAERAEHHPAQSL